MRTVPASSGPAARRTVARRCAAVLAAGVLLPLPLVGCGSGSQGDTDAGNGGGADAARDVPSVPRDQVAGGGTLKWAVDAAPTTLNVFQPDAGEATDRIAGATLPTLFTLDEKAQPQPNPDFLREAEVTSTEPRQTVVYKLNPKARWSDGRRIGVADFQAQWKALRGKDSAYWTARNAGYDRVGKISKGPGAHEVKVVFAKPYSDWQSLFTPLYPKSVMSEPSAFNDGARTSLPAYAGPFRAEKTGKKAGTATLVRNPKWWGDRAKLRRIELTAVPREKRESELAAGKLDVADVDAPVAKTVKGANKLGRHDKHAKPAGGPLTPQLSGEEPGTADRAGEKGEEKAGGRSGGRSEGGTEDKGRADGRTKAEAKAAKQAAKARRLAMKRLKGYTLRAALDPAYTQLALNGSNGPLADERVRRAVARALDREELAKQVLGDTGLPVEPLGSHLRMVNQDGYKDNSDAVGGRDVESAQTLLGEAGWKGGGPLAGSKGQKPAAGAGKPGSASPEASAKATDKDSAKDSAKDSDKDSAKATDKGNGEKEQKGKGADEKSKEHKAAGGPGEPPAEKPGDAQAPDGAVPARHRLEAEAAAVPLSPAQVAKVTGKPLGLTSSTASQRAAILAQAARIKLDEAREGDSERKLRRARASLASAQDLRNTAGELRLLSGGTATAVRTKGGKPLALRFVLPAGPGSETIRATGERVTEMLNAVGIRTQIKEVPNESYFKDHIAAGEYDLALYSWPASAYPSTDARPIFAKPKPAADGSLLVEQNYSRVGTDQIDQLFDQAAGELDDKRRAELMEKADSRIWAAAGSLPLYQRPQLVAVKDRVANAGAFGFQTPRYQDIGYRRD